MHSTRKRNECLAGNFTEFILKSVANRSSRSIQATTSSQLVMKARARRQEPGRFRQLAAQMFMLYMTRRTAGARSYARSREHCCKHHCFKNYLLFVGACVRPRCDGPTYACVPLSAKPLCGRGFSFTALSQRSRQTPWSSWASRRLTWATLGAGVNSATLWAGDTNTVQAVSSSSTSSNSFSSERSSGSHSSAAET